VGDDLAALGDEFATGASLARWTQFHVTEGWPSMVRRAEVRPATGELYLEPHTSGWYADFHAPFLYQEVTGDFVVTARLRADALDGGVPKTPWSLAGLMARAPRAITRATWTPRGENWVFITTGVAEEPGVPVFETKTTVQSQSQLRLHPARAGWVELRMTRVGPAFELASRYDGEAWVVRARFERADLPATLQVGLNAYTDWYHATPMHGDPLRFNTTVLTDGKPDLGLRVDWVRFARPTAGVGTAAAR
jgi:regulation of enolase protein 1 (concanavalin A-like superfamily)